ncbi:MAG: cupin domain-containing protein [Actinomycetota bacterium]|jgi:gentisate 1,2-dioxygenase|nr:cupin domain-containing protein [Actinomycetota bacterium]
MTSAETGPDRTSAGEPLVLVGESIEDWTGDARFFEYTEAVDPLAAGAITPVVPRRFGPELHEGGPTRIVPLDCSDALGVPYTATSPALLASYIVVRPGEMVATAPDGTSELYYCLSGSGHSDFETGATGDDQSSGTMPWQAGDLFVLPARCTTVHNADPVDGEGDGDRVAVLYRVTDAPLLHYLGVRPWEGRFRPTRFDGAAARARLAEVAAHPDAAARSRVSVLLGNTATPQTLTVTHTLWAMLGVLPPGRVQRPHRHQSVALDLIVDCEPGCYSLVGDELDASGAIVDPERVDWQPGGAFVTPPGSWHSHHNESRAPAHLLPVQDAGLHTYLRSLGIRFAPPTT